MATDLSPRLEEIVDALPLRPGLRVLEIGCGPGSAARAVAKRIGNGQVLGIDRSAKAIASGDRASCQAADPQSPCHRLAAVRRWGPSASRTRS